MHYVYNVNILLVCIRYIFAIFLFVIPFDYKKDGDITLSFLFAITNIFSNFLLSHIITSYHCIKKFPIL